jgi:hypothetical protein
MGGINILTDAKYGVFVDGAEEVIDLYEKGEIDQSDLLNAVLDLDVVYRSSEAIGE